MTSTTPPSTTRRSKSPLSRSRPTTPLRPSSRSSLRSSASRGLAASSTPNALEALSDGFAELSDAMADLEVNLGNLHVMHESLARFSESFAGFLYGLNMNAFCVDFPEAPIKESFLRPQNAPPTALPSRTAQDPSDPEATFLTTDTSFVEHPPSSKTTSRFQNAPQTPRGEKSRGGAGRGRGGATGGIPRAGWGGGGIPRAGRGGRGSGIARGAAGRGRAGRSQ